MIGTRTINLMPISKFSKKSTLKEENISTRGKKCTVILEREGNIRIHKIFFFT